MAPLDGRSRPTAQLEQKRDQRLGRNARRLVYRRFARQPSDFGIPGTGIFWTEQLNSKVAPRPQPPHAGHQVSFVIFLLAVVVAIIALHGVP